MLIQSVVRTDNADTVHGTGPIMLIQSVVRTNNADTVRGKDR